MISPLISAHLSKVPLALRAKTIICGIKSVFLLHYSNMMINYFGKQTYQLTESQNNNITVSSKVEITVKVYYFTFIH